MSISKTIFYICAFSYNYLILEEHPSDTTSTPVLKGGILSKKLL